MAKAAKAEAPKGGDHVGVFPRELDTDALPERRTAALARMLAVVAVVEGCALVAMSFALAAITPLQKVVPMVVSSNPKGDEIVHINPATFDSPTADYVAEISLRNYVTKRYSIVGSEAEQATNWSQGSAVQLMSTPESYKIFMGVARPEWTRLRAENKIRTVRIDSVRKINDTTWQVEYVTADMAQTSPMEGAPSVEQHTWVTTLEIKYEPKNVTYNDRLNNPFGVTVTSVSDARRD